MKTENEKKEVNANSEAKKTLSKNLLDAISKVNTEEKMKQVSNKSALIWNLEKIRNAEKFESIKYSSDSTIRNRMRKLQDSIIYSLLHNIKLQDEKLIEESIKNLKDLNSYLFDEKNFSNKKRSNLKDIELAYNIYFELR